MHANPNTIASLQCQENQQNCYIARLIVRLEVKLSPLGRAHPFLLCPLTWTGTQKSGGHIKKFSAGDAPQLSNCFWRHHRMHWIVDLRVQFVDVHFVLGLYLMG